MNADDLKTVIQGMIDNRNDIGIAVYGILKDDQNPKKIDISADALSGLKSLFLSHFQDSILNKESLSVVGLSTSDERLDAIYLYDLEAPEELNSMNQIVTSDEVPLLDLRYSELGSLKAILVEIGNHEQQIVLYKKMSPVNIFQRSSFFLIKRDTRLEKIDDDFLRISPNFQLMRIGDDLLVFDLEMIEKSFSFHDIITREATLGVTAIEAKQILDNPQTLTELVDDVKYARRLTKVGKASPVLRANIPNQSIIQFCKTFPKLAGRIRFNDAGDKIVLDTKVSKDLFIKLMMDDFLTSELTNFHYESVAKDPADVAEVVGAE
jgi:hypothetical protein